MGIFTDIFTNDAAKDAARAKIAGINSGLQQSNSAFDTGQGQANPLYGQAYGNFGALASKFGAGQDAYNDATGVNGADGSARATAAFQSTPGYQSGINMALDQNDRRAASRGMLASGNTDAETAKLATDYSNQHYNDYVSHLAPNLSGALSATSGGAGVLGNQAGQYLNVAGQRAGVANNAAQGIGNANADAETARGAASKNFWGALMGGAQLAMGMPPTSWSGVGQGEGGDTSGLNPFARSPSYGGGNMWNSAYGGSSRNPLPGLDQSDYGWGY